MEELFSKILELKKLREGIPQFLFCEAVYPLQTIAVRQQILEYIKEGNNCKEIDFIINSPGGLADEAYKIIRTLRHNFETVNIIIPFWAKSAATLLSLGGTKIIMDEFGEFGPLDAQLGKVRDDSPELERESALNDEHSLRRIETRFKEMFETIFIRIYEHKKINIPKAELSNQLFENLSKFYEPLLKQIDPYKLGEKRRKLDIGGQYAKRILAQFSSLKDQMKIREFVDFLVDGCPDHGYVIDYDLITLFLDNVFTSENFFGKAYANKLSEISLILIMEDEPIEHIGFINQKSENDTLEIETASNTANENEKNKDFDNKTQETDKAA
jgi:hypothetical protein